MLFRNPHLARAVATFLLVEIVSNLVYPSISFAAMGTGQPEFTSYAPGESSDLVDLTTGDFKFSLPILDIPGPERSFSIPLSYKSGIELEQEASWVGLGWTLNAGAISRSVNNYPDDAAGEQKHSFFDKEVASHTYSVVIPGIYHTDKNNYGGTTGSVDLIGIIGTSWDNDGIVSGDIIGIGGTRGEGMTFDVERFGAGMMTVASLGGGSAASVAGKVGQAVITSAATEMVIGMASDMSGKFALGKMGGTIGYQTAPIDHTSGTWAESERRLFFLTTPQEYRYGSLYFGKMSQRVETGQSGISIKTDNTLRSAPKFVSSRRCDNDNFGYQTSETAADIYQAGPTYGNTYANSNPISIAHDNFSVMGAGVSGIIRPNRLEVGSIAYPKIGTDNCYNHAKYMVVPYKDDYKVGFRYESDLSNSYTYHQNGQDIGLEASADKQSLVITDRRLFDAATRIEPTRKGLAATSAGQQLVQGKHVVWYSNAEIEQMTNVPFTGYANGFVDFETPQANNTTTNTFRHELPATGIGAFAVTSEDGSTYHYSLPVYQFGTITEAFENRLSTTVGNLGHFQEVQSFPFASTWLLTAITSPDYVDRNNSGTVDEGDWGGWTKFTYGKFSSSYTWRQPYVGSTYSSDKNPIEYEIYSQGTKETYYLNTISTRTHTALFVKSIRQDGRGLPVNNTAGMGLASSLRLDEIILMDNTAMHQLYTADAIRAANDPNTTPIPALTNNTANNATPSDSGDDLGAVLDTQDLIVDARIRAFVDANTLKRVRFNYSYDLCPGTPSSFVYDYANPQVYPPMDVAHAAVNRGGKLTLNSVSVFGPTVSAQPTKLMPDFVFGYDVPGFDNTQINPAYGTDKWDAYGMYNPLGAHNTISHSPAANSYAAPWTLTSITSPLGGITTIAYERDDYSHVSENGAQKIKFYSDGSSRLTISNTELAKLGNSLPNVIHVDDKLELNGVINYQCTCNLSGLPGSPSVGDVNQHVENQIFTVQSVNQTGITLTAGFYCLCGGTGGFGGISCGMTRSPSGEITAALKKNVKGGDVRVASLKISTDDITPALETRYQYTDGEESSFNSSGVVTKEPDFLDKAAHKTDNMFDYPVTPVLYSRVTVLRGPFSHGNGLDYDNRQVFNFFSANSNMVSEDLDWTYSLASYNPSTGVTSGDSRDFYNNQTIIKTGLIGRAKSIQIYNRQGYLEQNSDFNYSNQVNNPDGIVNQGYFTEGVLNTEGLRLGGQSLVYETNRSTKQYVPSVLVGTTSQRNGVEVANRNVLFDFYTGQVLETAFTSSSGRVYHSRRVPAYTLPGNGGMGPKGDSPSNAHMLAQVGAAYSFAEIPGGPVYDYKDPFNPRTTHMLSASVQTWQPVWLNYREATSSGAYQDITGTPQQSAWRQKSAYVWQSSALNPDGSFANFVDYSWAGASDMRWLKASENVRFDHFSHVLETKDANGLYSASKTGHDNTQILASVTNAKYTEFAYSGAEDLPVTINSLKHFGGEVVTDGDRVTSKQHTGNYCDQLNGGQKLRYQALAGTELATGKTYRLSAWVHASDFGPKLARLYASVNGNIVAEATIANAKKAGEWYRLMLNVPLTANQAGQSVEFGCKNSGGTSAAPVYVDDFRVCPLQAGMSSQVYDPRTNRLIYSLDNENLFTRYQYNSDGRIYRVYQEVLDQLGNTAPAARLVKEYAYNYARNSQYIVSVTATGVPSGIIISPSASKSVITGDAANFDLTADCAYIITGFEVDGDGVARQGSYTLPDHTRISLISSHLSVTNAHAAHAIAVSYQFGNFDPINTVYSGNCEMDGNSCYTGNYLYSIADGCGGTISMIRQATLQECPAQPGCLGFKANPAKPRKAGSSIKLDSRVTPTHDAKK